MINMSGPRRLIIRLERCCPPEKSSATWTSPRLPLLPLAPLRSIDSTRGLQTHGVHKTVTSMLHQCYINVTSLKLSDWWHQSFIKSHTKRWKIKLSPADSGVMMTEFNKKFVNDRSSMTSIFAHTQNLLNINPSKVKHLGLFDLFKT